MKKVIVISSTPRRGGNSEVLAEEFARGAGDAGHLVEVIDLRDYHLNYCVACYSCTESGKCVIGDGMNEIAEKLLEADVIVFATPVYFYSMSGQLKVFIDRLVPVYTKIKSDIYIIATQWDESTDMMEKVIDSIRGCTVDCFENCEEKGVLYGVGLTDIGDAEKKPEFLATAYEMGKNC
ncbi:MAG: flavodoxin family protein [Clostridia bacterium]|nr:flavodoxin family protein [Clostridia bacterium]